MAIRFYKNFIISINVNDTKKSQGGKNVKIQRMGFGDI